MRPSFASHCLHLLVIFTQIFVSSVAVAGGKMIVPLTPERVAACQAYLTKNGIELPPGASITKIAITVNDWKCTSCGSKVSGVQASFPNEAAKCDNCGSPMEPNTGEVYDTKPADGHVVLRDDQIDAVFKQGQNWTCSYCNSGGNRDMKIIGEISTKVTECENCGAPRADYEQFAGKNTDASPKKKWDGKRWKPSDAQIAAGENPNPAPSVDTSGEIPREKREELEQMGVLKPVVQGRASAHADELDIAARKAHDENVAPQDLRQVLLRNKKGVIIGGGIIVAIGVMIFRYYTLKDTPDKGKVINARWVQTVRAEQFQPVIERGKKSQIKESEPVMPVNGQGEKPGAKIIECSGDSCLYETYKWIETDSKVVRGNYGQPIPQGDSWAQLSVPTNGRIMSNTRYDADVEFSHNGEGYTLKWRPQTDAEFQQFKPGSEITAQIDALGNLKNVQVGGKK